MASKRANVETLTRYQVADLARRGHEMADRAADRSESPRSWRLAYEEIRSIAARIADLALLNRFAAAAEPDDENGDARLDLEWALHEVGDDPTRLTRIQRQAIEVAASALDGLANEACDFAQDGAPVSGLPGFLRAALAVAVDRLVRFDDVLKLRPGASRSECTRYAAALVDLGLAQTLYRDHFHIYPPRCTYWLEEHDPMKKTGDIVHGDKFEIGTGVAVGRGASAPGAVIQDNRYGGVGSIEASQANLDQFLTQLVSAVNGRDDAPGEAIVAAAEAKALARSKEPGKALAALQRGGKWLLEVTKELAVKVGQEYVMHELGIK